MPEPQKKTIQLPSSNYRNIPAPRFAERQVQSNPPPGETSRPPIMGNAAPRNNSAQRAENLQIQQFQQQQ